MPLDTAPSTAARALFALAAATIPFVACACDLSASFVAPAGSALAGGKPVEWQLRLANVAATGDCPANQVTLLRESGAVAGSMFSVGAAGSAQPLAALQPGQSVLLGFVEARPPSSGTFVYRPSYTTKFLDPNERNHQPTKTVTFAVTLTLGN